MSALTAKASSLLTSTRAQEQERQEQQRRGQRPPPPPRPPSGAGAPAPSRPYPPPSVSRGIFMGESRYDPHEERSVLRSFTRLDEFAKRRSRERELDEMSRFLARERRERTDRGDGQSTIGGGVGLSVASGGGGSGGGGAGGPTTRRRNGGWGGGAATRAVGVALAFSALCVAAWATSGGTEGAGGASPAVAAAGSTTAAPAALSAEDAAAVDPFGAAAAAAVRSLKKALAAAVLGDRGAEEEEEEDDEEGPSAQGPGPTTSMTQGEEERQLQGGGSSSESSGGGMLFGVQEEQRAGGTRGLAAAGAAPPPPPPSPGRRDKPRPPAPSPPPLRVLSLGGSTTYGSHLERRMQAYPYVLANELLPPGSAVTNIALRATRPDYAGMRLQTLVSERSGGGDPAGDDKDGILAGLGDVNYDVITVEYSLNGMQRLPLLLRRLRRRYPTAPIVYVHLWSLRTSVVDADTGNAPRRVFNDPTLTLQDADAKMREMLKDPGARWARDGTSPNGQRLRDARAIMAEGMRGRPGIIAPHEDGLYDFYGLPAPDDPRAGRSPRRVSTTGGSGSTTTTCPPGGTPSWRGGSRGSWTASSTGRRGGGRSPRPRAGRGSSRGAGGRPLAAESAAAAAAAPSLGPTTPAAIGASAGTRRARLPGGPTSRGAR